MFTLTFGNALCHSCSVSRGGVFSIILAGRSPLAIASAKDTLSNMQKDPVVAYLATMLVACEV